MFLVIPIYHLLISSIKCLNFWNLVFDDMFLDAPLQCKYATFCGTCLFYWWVCIVLLYAAAAAMAENVQTGMWRQTGVSYGLIIMKISFMATIHRSIHRLMLG